jgi:hypothetical protein
MVRVVTTGIEMDEEETGHSTKNGRYENLNGTPSFLIRKRRQKQILWRFHSSCGSVRRYRK